MRILSTLCAILLPALAMAQSDGGSLRGTLTDNSGAVIPAAAVSLVSPAGARATTTRIDGTYSFAGLPPGAYTVRVAYPGFGLYEKAVSITAGKSIDLPIRLAVSAEKQQVTVTGEPGSALSVESDNNAGALIMKGQDLDALPDDPGDLNDMLQMLAGPGAGPNGGQLYVDGFSGGKLPAKSSIREIRINQNPFSAEYDRLGMGRIEILTKPGTDKFRGAFGLFDSDAYFNSRNPYADNKADYSNRFFWGNVGGSISKRATFFFNAEIQRIDNDALIHAVTLDGPVQSSVLTPSHEVDFEPRLDYQLSKNHTLTARWDYTADSRDNNGIGQYSLQSRAYNTDSSSHEIRLTETAILSARAVNDTRVAIDHNRNNQYGTSTLPALQVSEAFTAGGDQVGRAYDINRRVELQNNTSLGRGAHTYRFGLRARHTSESDYSPFNFGGTFTFFGVGAAPVLDANNQAIPGTAVAINSLEQYRRTLLFQKLGYAPDQVRASGGGASQFSIAGGNPLAEIAQTDLGMYAQDDWKVRPNLTFSYGLRYEAQTNIGDAHDFAPRIGIAWAPRAKSGKPQKTVIRIGAGFYYDRVGQNLSLQQLRANGVNQQEFVITNPDFFPNVAAVSALTASAVPLSTYKLDSTMRAPRMVQSAVSLERQLPGKTTLSATYLAMHTSHTLRTVNINSPLPGSGLRPYGNAGNLFLYESDGTMNQNMFVAAVNNRLSQKVSFSVNYQLMSAHTDADNLAFPSNTYDFKADYGRPAFMRRHRAFFMGNFMAPGGMRFSPNVVTASGVPYNLITGRDLNGDTISNDRPAFATDLTRPSVLLTRFGAFDTNPLPGAKIVPRNFLTGDPMWNFNLRIGRDIKFGKVTDKEHRYTSNLSFSVNNVFNHLNRGGWVGNLGSPLFGQSTAINLFRETSNNRRVQFGTTFSF